MSIQVSRIANITVPFRRPGAGARVLHRDAGLEKRAEGTPFWGIYSGYFQDPDGHLREIIWNPRMLPAGVS